MCPKGLRHSCGATNATYIHVEGHARELRASANHRKTYLDRNEARRDNFEYTCLTSQNAATDMQTLFPRKGSRNSISAG